jgi:hypothetical protein
MFTYRKSISVTCERGSSFHNVLLVEYIVMYFTVKQSTVPKRIREGYETSRLYIIYLNG